MKTKMLVKKPEPDSGKTNNPVTNNHKNKPAENKKNVMTTDYKKLLQMMLNDPDAITREEFLFLQSIIGYRQAVAAREKAKLRKQQRKIEQTNVAMKPNLLGRSNSEIEKDSGGKKEGTSSKDNSTKTPIQMKKDDGNTSATSSSMQHNLRAGLEKLSGVDLSDVKVHRNSDKPQHVGALAYTQGNDIHVAPGQEKHIPHEGWHAVQQKQGRVKSTMQLKTGTLVNDDTALEKEADVMGSRAAKDSSNDGVTQLKRTYYIHGQESKVIQRITQEEAMRISKENTHKQEKTSNNDITPSALGEKSENVKKIQQVLIRMNYWTGEDKATGYFGDVTKDSLIKFQLGYMKLQRNDIFDKKGNYVGCGAKTAKSLNNLYKLLYNSNVPDQAKSSIMEIGKNKERNSSYGWDIKAGEYNANVKEAQLMLMNLGYKLPKYGADGKWSGSGETFNAIKNFQNSCKVTYNGLNKDLPAQTLVQFNYMQGVEPTGKLDKATGNALEKEVSKKVNAGKAQAEKSAVKNGTTPVNGTEYIFSNPDLWLNNKDIIIDLYALEAHLKSTKGISFWKMSVQQKDILYKGLRTSENTTTPDIMFNRIQAIRTIYDIPEKNGLTFIDSATVQGIIKEELQIQAAETWKKRIPLYLGTIKDRVQNSNDLYIDFINLSKQEKKAIQYSLKLYQTGDLDADTANAIENLKTKNRIKAIDKHAFALDVATMNVIIQLCKKRTDWGNKYKVLSDISDFAEEYKLGELFYSIVVGWVSAPSLSIGKTEEKIFKIPQGLTSEQFANSSKLIRQSIGNISDDIVVQGSRAGGTAKVTSDIDYAIRVSPEKFDELIKQRFGIPNPGSAKERTMLNAIKTGKIQAGEAGLRGLRKQLQEMLGIDVDISIIKSGGAFDNGPMLKLPK